MATSVHDIIDSIRQHSSSNHERGTRFEKLMVGNQQQIPVSVIGLGEIDASPNDWSDDPRYIIDLLGRIVTVSLETVDIVEGLPGLEILKN